MKKKKIKIGKENNPHYTYRDQEMMRPTIDNVIIYDKELNNPLYNERKNKRIEP